MALPPIEIAPLDTIVIAFTSYGVPYAVTLANDVKLPLLSIDAIAVAP